MKVRGTSSKVFEEAKPLVVKVTVAAYIYCDKGMKYELVGERDRQQRT